ncbi:aspartyl/asparaginyl beta-hydroxylase domain-containing protein [Kribbella sp. CA-294648]|uniref:aspartyl/asparaginyl beta-hydroxylase domain-containing protein n=1 Tax=Kribbella sp. CA-294648 TaxID=3239948 RepID=UPI003D8F173C
MRFSEPADFPWIHDLETEWKVIRDDLDVALADRERVPGFATISPRQRSIADERSKTLVFHFFGRRVDENCARFPATAAVLERIPDLTTAMFSILGEGAHIPPHFGPYKGILRYHLGLRVPEGAGIRVDNETRSWEEVRSMIFDDTFEHEAWNPGPGDRVVLFIDILRPLPRALDQFNRGFFQIVKNTATVREVQSKASAKSRTA